MTWPTAAHNVAVLVATGVLVWIAGMWGFLALLALADD